MQYNWTPFNLKDAMAGTLVGIRNADKPYDLSLTGRLNDLTTFTDGGGYFRLTLRGHSLTVDLQGRITSCYPSNAAISSATLMMCTAEMGTDSAVGSAVTRSDGSSGEGRSATASLSVMEPRDHFAVSALSAMMVHADNPETFDDATCLMYSRAAYRWAQAMMIAAADSREGTSTTQSEQVEVNSNDLQSNTEKVLFNLNESLKELRKQIEKGLTVAGTDKEDSDPVRIAVSALPDVNVSGSVAVTSLPQSDET